MNLRRARSIRAKLNVIVAVTTLLALLVAAAALLAFDLREQLRQTEQDLVAQADVIALASSPALTFADRAVATENLSLLRAKPGVLQAALYDEAGELFAAFSPYAELPPVPGRPEPHGLSAGGGSVRVWRPIVVNAEQLGTIYVSVRDHRPQRALDYLRVLALIVVASLGVALLLSNRLQRSLTGPILDVSAVAQKVLRGEAGDVRARKSSDDEVGALVDAFNAMLDELGRRAQTLQSTIEALRTSETRYQLAVHGSSAGLWDWDIRAGEVFYSPVFKSMLGYTEAAFPGQPVIHPDDRAKVDDALQAHLAERVPYQVECRMQDSAGNWRWLFIAGKALWDDGGRAYRMAGSVIDVTARKQAEQVLEQASRAKDEFIATLAHELRNPLAPIRTGLEILKKDRAHGPASDRARATMERQLDHLIRLVDDLLDISRINSGKIRLELSRLRLSAVVETAVEISRPAMAAAGHAFGSDLPDEDIELMGDPTRLAQALGNLLNNAAKYTPPGGRIMLRVRRAGALACVEVQDNGEGIPTGMLDKVFSLFTQGHSTLGRAQGGLGIGLYLVRTLVELHGGRVEAQSAGPGCGSTFTLCVPCLPPSASAQAEPAAAQAPGPVQKGLRVLIVDDNIDAAHTLALALELERCRTHVVHDGSAALQAAREFDPEVVLLDIGLPGLTGYEVAAQLRSDPALSGILLVAITGWGAEQDRRRTREAGFDHHLTKPVEFSALATLLAARRAERKDSPASLA